MIAGEQKVRLTQRRAAWILGCTYQHLSACLKGKRESKSLMERYQDLVARHSEGKLTEVEGASLRQYQVVTTAAKILSVFPDHLVAVLRRERQDAALLKRYRTTASLLTHPRVMLDLISPARRCHNPSRGAPDRGGETVLTQTLQEQTAVKIPKDEPKQKIE